MALNEKQQFNELITQAKHILICFKKDFSGDALASTLALAGWLTRQNKRFTIVCDEFKTPKEWQFLNGIEKIESQLLNLLRKTKCVIQNEN